MKKYFLLFITMLILVLFFSNCAPRYANFATRKDYVDAHPELTSEIRTAILQGNLILSMTQDQVRASWGEPHKVNRTVGIDTIWEEWIYSTSRTKYVYFQNGIMIRMGY